LVVAPPEKKIALPSKDVELAISEDQWNTLFKALGTLSVPELVVEGKEGYEISVATTDTRNESSNRYDIGVGETASADFRVIFKAENLKLFPGDYDIAISSKKISEFNNAKAGVKYFIAVEASSTF
jgi:hypothetical protein